jgi:thiamine-phosphate pyrophosphorylase
MSSAHPAPAAPWRELAVCRLYGILDLGYVAAANAVPVAREMIAGGVDILQVRAKHLAPAAILDLVRELRPLANTAGVPLIINDHPALAAAAGADGVHIGQDDGPISAARAAAGPGKLVGRSTHSLAQARAARAEGADYLGFGPLFATPTKPDYPAIGLEHIAQVQAEITDRPVFCIGGIKLENLPEVIAAGARRVVIVSGILLALDVAKYTRQAAELLADSPL